MNNCCRLHPCFVEASRRLSGVVSGDGASCRLHALLPVLVLFEVTVVESFNYARVVAYASVAAFEAV